MEILPPRKKVKLTFDPAPEHVDPPPIVCAICESEQPSWQFGALGVGDTPICWGCEGMARFRRPRLDIPNWNDGTWLMKASTALWHLNEGIRHGRGAANPR